MSWYRDRPRTIKHSTTIENADGYLTAATYDVGRYIITVPVIQNPNGVSEPEEITVAERSRSDRREQFESLRIEDGQVMLSITDLADNILERAEPAEIAQALIEKDDVREMLTDLFGDHWSRGGVTSRDRQRFLERVHEALRYDGVYACASKLASLEYEERRKWNQYEYVRSINDRLRNLEVRDPYTGELLQFKEPVNDADNRIGGLHWDKARDYWRERMEQLVPAVTAEPVARFPADVERALDELPVDSVDLLRTFLRTQADLREFRAAAEASWATPPAPFEMPEPVVPTSPTEAEHARPSYDTDEEIPF